MLKDEDDVGLNRKQIGITVILFVYIFSYLLTSIFPILALYVPSSSSPLIVLSAISLFILYLLFICPFAIKRIGKFEYQEVEWLRMHRILDFLRVFLMAEVVVPIMIFASLFSDLGLKMFAISWFLMFGIFSSFFFHQATIAIGMDYVRVDRVDIPPLQRATIFAELSRLKLRKQDKTDKTALAYLSASLIILRENLKRGKKTLQDLNVTISALDTINSFAREIPFYQLLFLANELKKLPAISDIESGLHSFLDSKEIKWTLDFVEMPSKKLNERLAIYFEKYLLPSILVVVTFLAVLPEGSRTSITDYLQKAKWTSIFGILVSLVLIAIYWSLYKLLVSFELSVKRGDIEEMRKLQTEGKEHDAEKGENRL